MKTSVQNMFKIMFCEKRNASEANYVYRVSGSTHFKGDLVPYPTVHRSEVRARIVQSARRLFNRHGFDNVSITRIMAGAGLTHGGFYSYFKSKNELYTEVLGCFFTDPNWKNCWEGVDVDLASPDVGSQVIHAYLSRQHFEDVENSCPMVALPSDVARGSKSSKRAFQAVFEGMVSVLERSLTGNGRPRRVVSQAAAALCVGGMVVSRALVDRGVADELRSACMAVALQLGGWNNKSKSTAGEKRVDLNSAKPARRYADDQRSGL